MQISVAHVTTIADSLKLLLQNQLCAIDRAGYQVTGISAPGPSSQALTTRGIRHLEAPFVRATGLTPMSDLRTFGHLVALFRRERFTIVHTHTAKPDLYAALAARVAGVPIVITTLHGFYFHDRMPWRTRQLFVMLARLGMAACDAVLSQNAEDIATAQRERICPAAKISLLGNGIDVERFSRTSVSRTTAARMRRDLGIAEDELVVGFCGRLVAEKGVLDLLAAAPAIRAQFPRARLLLIGWYDREKQDAIDPAKASELGLAEMCIFTGHRDDLPELYAVMDVFVLPSHREGFPRTVMEASAMELPVVATDIRGCRSAVVDQETGVLVPERDPAALTTAITRLLADAELRRRMASAGRALALAQFDERRVFATVLATYERLLARRGLAPPSPRTTTSVSCGA